MLLHIVYDDRGEILSANTPMPASADANPKQYGAVLAKGQHFAEVEVPETYVTWGLAEIAQRLRISANTLVPKSLITFHDLRAGPRLGARH